MKGLLLTLSLVLSLSTFGNDLYGITLKQTDGKELKLSSLKGKAVLFVNVATRCGYTGQLDDLEKLHQKYKTKKFTVVGIPSNDFKGQTPEGNEEVAKFCRLKYGVTFPLTEKAHVKGDKKIDLIKILQKDEHDIKWNFEKFLVNANGDVVARFGSGVEPLSKEVTTKIESIL